MVDKNVQEPRTVTFFLMNTRGPQEVTKNIWIDSFRVQNSTAGRLSFVGDRKWRVSDVIKRR